MGTYLNRCKSLSFFITVSCPCPSGTRYVTRVKQECRCETLVCTFTKSCPRKDGCSIGNLNKRIHNTKVCYSKQDINILKKY